MSELRHKAALRITAAAKEAPAWLLRYGRPREFDTLGDRTIDGFLRGLQWLNVAIPTKTPRLTSHRLKWATEYFAFPGYLIPIPSTSRGERGVYVSEATCALAIICSGLRYEFIDDRYVAAYASLPKTNRRGPVVYNNLFPACLEVGPR